MRTGYPVIDQFAKSNLLQNRVGDWKLDSLPTVRNVAKYTEDMSWVYHNAGGCTKTGQYQYAEIDGKIILFGRFVADSVSTSRNIEIRFSTATLTPFVIGKKYMVSAYMFSPHSHWFYMRTVATSDYGHNCRYIEGQKITRVWAIGQATTTSALDYGNSPLVALGAVAGEHPKLVYQLGWASLLDVWIGGVQIETVADDEVDGIAMIGDSTMAGATADKDVPRDFSIRSNMEVSYMLGAALQCSVFNRASGGERLDEMDARWATDITPMAARCKYAFIQGGINDIAQGRTLAQMQTSLQSMVTKAEADGLICRFMTVTASASNDATEETLRQTYNAWLLSTYGTACANVESLTVDPATGNTLHPSNTTDGTHYDGNLKYTIGKFLATELDWEFTQPIAYEPVDMPTKISQYSKYGSPRDISSTITTGGTAQVLFNGVQSGVKLYFQNTSDTDMWINETGSTAVAASPSLKIAAGTIYESPDGAPIRSAISLICATTGKAFTARVYYH